MELFFVSSAAVATTAAFLLVIVLACDSPVLEFQEQVDLRITTKGRQQNIDPRPDQECRDNVDAEPDRGEQDRLFVEFPCPRDADTSNRDHQTDPDEPNNAPWIKDFSHGACILFVFRVDGQYHVRRFVVNQTDGEKYRHDADLDDVRHDASRH